VSGISSVGPTVFWSAATLGFYFLSKRAHRRFRAEWAGPLVLAPILLIAMTLVLHKTYDDYIHETKWLVSFVGPCTVAFAIPIWEHRALIRRYWPVLIVSVVVGSATSMLSARILARLLGLDQEVVLSLMPRSMSTPFALAVSRTFGGNADLTAFFVVVTAVFGAAVGELMLTLLPVRSVISRGALFGMGAHGAGVTRAHQLGHEEGSIAGVVMVLVGIFNVLVAPWVRHLVR